MPIDVKDQLNQLGVRIPRKWEEEEMEGELKQELEQIDVPTQ